MSNQTITENTNVKLGFILSLVAFGIGAVWWAASVQTKMDALLVSVNECTVSMKTTGIMTSTLQSELRILDATGTKKCVELTKELSELKQRVHTLENKKQ